MKRNLRNLVAALFSKENKSRSFYVLALVPTILMSYSHVHSPLGPTIPLYSFIILILKKQKLFPDSKVHNIQKLFGLTMLCVSFFAYFIASPLYSDISFYGFANYSLYIVGLFLIFFPVIALKEAFSPLFLAASVFIAPFISKRAELYLTPYLPHFTSFIASLLRAIGMKVAQSSSYPNMITLSYTLKSPISLMIAWGCVGFYSMFVFCVILIIIMLEDPSSTKTKVLWSTLGVLGTFLVNIIRIVTLFVGLYFYGYEFYDTHLYTGYILFITWIAVFFYLFAKRNIILQKIRTMRTKSAREPHRNVNLKPCLLFVLESSKRLRDEGGDI